MVKYPAYCILQHTGIPGEPVPLVAKGFLWRGKHLEHQTAVRSLEGNKETTTRGRQEARAAAAALALPSTRLQDSRWSRIITEVQTKRPPPTMGSPPYHYQSLQRGTLRQVESKINMNV